MSKHQRSARGGFATAIRTQQEVAEIMTARGYPMGKSNVCMLETKAIRKLRRGLADMAREFGFDVGDQERPDAEDHESQGQRAE